MEATPESIASRHGLPLHQGTMHVVAVLRALEEDKLFGLLNKLCDNNKKEYEVCLSLSDTVPSKIVADVGFRYGFLTLLLSSLFTDTDTETDEVVSKAEVDELKARLLLGARNLSKVLLEISEEEGNA